MKKNPPYQIPCLQTPNLSITLSRKKPTVYQYCVVEEQLVQTHDFFRHSFVLNRTLRIRHLVTSCDTSNHRLKIDLKISFHFQDRQRNKQERTDPCSFQKRHYSRPTLKLENSLSSQYVQAWDRDPPLAMR